MEQLASSAANESEEYLLPKLSKLHSRSSFSRCQGREYATTAPRSISIVAAQDSKTQLEGTAGALQNNDGRGAACATS